MKLALRKLASRTGADGSTFEVFQTDTTERGITLQYTLKDCGVEDHKDPCVEEWGVLEEDIGTLLLAIIRHQMRDDD